MNAHAGIVGSDRKTTTKRFSSLFAKFVQALEKSGYIGDYLDQSESEVAGAYWMFMRCLKSEVKTSKRVKPPKPVKTTKPVKTAKPVKTSQPVKISKPGET